MGKRQLSIKFNKMKMKIYLKRKTTESYLEIGRIVFINFGPSNGKLAIIIEILDKNRCMIDGPSGRQVINIKRIKPTKIKIKIGRSVHSREVHKILQSQNIIKYWENSRWAKKEKNNQKKKKFSDFELFKYMLGKKTHKRILG